MRIEPLSLALEKCDIDRVLDDWSKNPRKWEKLIATYGFLRNNLASGADDREYERAFNWFYQVRRNAAWRKHFYEVFRTLTVRKTVSFEHILLELFRRTGNVEASFASKLAATFDPSLPIIDRHVLSYVGRKLPSGEKGERLAAIAELHKAMDRGFKRYLESAGGRYLVRSFRARCPALNMHEMKMLDLVLWQSKGKNIETKKP